MHDSAAVHKRKYILVLLHLQDIFPFAITLCCQCLFKITVHYSPERIYLYKLE